MSTKTILIILVNVLVLAAIPATIFLVGQRQELRQRAAPATTLTLTASPISLTVNSTVTVNVAITTGANQVLVTELYLNFDPTKLEVQDILPGPFFPTPQTTGKSLNNTTGQAALTVFIPTSTQPKSGTGIVAKATFKAKASGSTTIRLSEDTLVGAIGESGNNVLTGSVPVTITIQSTGAATPTPTPTPTIHQQLTVTPTSIEPPSPTPLSENTSTPLEVTEPPSGAVTTSNQPMIKGQAKPGSTITVVIHSTKAITAVVTADTNGNWSYTPTTTLADGSHIATIMEQASDGTTRTTTSTFIIQTTPIPVTGTGETTMFLSIAGILCILFGIIIRHQPYTLY